MVKSIDSGLGGVSVVCVTGKTLYVTELFGLYPNSVTYNVLPVTQTTDTPPKPESIDFTIYQPSSITSPYFFGPRKFIAVTPKKLVIADDGLFFYTDNDAWNFKNSDRIIVVDLENFSIESINNTSVEFENQISQNLISGSTYGVIASSYFGTDSIYHTLLPVYDPLNDPAYVESGTV